MHASVIFYYIMALGMTQRHLFPKKCLQNQYLVTSGNCNCSLKLNNPMVGHFLIVSMFVNRLD